MSRPLFEVGEEVIVHNPGDYGHGRAEVILESAWYPLWATPTWIPAGACTNEGWWYHLPDEGEPWWVLESCLRKKHKPAGESLEDMITRLNHELIES